MVADVTLEITKIKNYNAILFLLISQLWLMFSFLTFSVGSNGFGVVCLLAAFLFIGVIWYSNKHFTNLIKANMPKTTPTTPPIVQI